MARGQGFVMAAAALCTLTWGCAKQGSTRAEPSPSSDVERSGADTGAYDANTPSGSESQPMALSDNQIVQVMHTINKAEIEQAREALQRSTDPQVQAYAQQMILDHEAADAQLTALGRTAGLSGDSSELSRQLEEQASNLQQALNDLEQASYDDAYLSAQTQIHQQTLQILDQVLLPSVSNPELRSVLSDVRPRLQQHLEHASTLLGTGTSPTP